MKKKISVIFILLAFIMTVGCFAGFKSNNVYANDFDFKSKSAYLMDAYSGTVVYKKDETKRLPIASMCKIMTLLLAFEEIESGNLSFSDSIVVSETASSMGGSQIFLEANAEYKIEELIKGIVVASANDASVAIAETICGSEDLFVDKMNKKAKELGMNNTCFVNCTGLPKQGQYSCAEDVAKMFCSLLKHKDYYRFSSIWMDEIEHPEGRITEISNTNKLIRFYDGCDSGKTGYTSEAGHCLCASAKRNGMRLISVIVSAPDSKTRFGEASSMFNYGFANFTNKLIVDDKKPLDVKVSVESGKKDVIEAIAERPLFIFSEKGTERAIELNFIPLDKVKAPVKKGEIIGKLIVYENNVEINSVNVIANEDILEATFFDVINDIINDWPII